MVVDIVQALILGTVQGLTEWLPISSSGHLAFIQLVLNPNIPVFFDLWLHLGTLAAVFAIYRKDIGVIVMAIALLPFNYRKKLAEGKEIRANPTLSEGSGASDVRNTSISTQEEGRRWAWLIIVGMIPTAIIGIVFRPLFEESFHDSIFVAAGFIINGLLILMTRFVGVGHKRLGIADAILIGLGQGISIFSSISRSGTTISFGMYRRVEREELVKYSFLISIPAILGATLLDLSSYIGNAQLWGSANISLNSYIVGILASGIVGYLSIRILMNMISSGRFFLFSIYSFGVGAMVFLLL